MGLKFVFKIEMAFLLSTLSMAIGCTRGLDSDRTTQVTLKVPSQKTLSKVASLVAFPSTGQLCWAANVTGEGIAGLQTSCGPQLGSFAGFVAEDGLLTLKVPRGTNRTVTVFLYHAASGETCPTWSGNLTQLNSLYGQVYQVGQVKNVNLEASEVTLDVVVSFPGESQNLLATLEPSTAICSGSPSSPSEMVLNSGQIVSVNGAPLVGTNPSQPTVHSAFRIGTQRGIYTQAGQVIIPSRTFDVHPTVSSITYKADAQKFYGLRHNGEVVEVSSSDGSITELVNSGLCPFNTCHVPPWLQSISAGNGTHLYALDHGGNIYSLDDSGMPIQSPQSLPASAVHFY